MRVSAQIMHKTCGCSQVWQLACYQLHQHVCAGAALQSRPPCVGLTLQQDLLLWQTMGGGKHTGYTLVDDSWHTPCSGVLVLVL